jgi:1-acyl-sn-glycerol-3-phosphate acyltransferase
VNIFKRNPFGHNLFIKKWLIRILGFLSHTRFNRFNKLKIEGSDVLRSIPKNNVLFVSNHQTYFAVVVAMLHVFIASFSGRVDSMNIVCLFWEVKLFIYLLAEIETM